MYVGDFSPECYYGHLEKPLLQLRRKVLNRKQKIFLLINQKSKNTFFRIFFPKIVFLSRRINLRNYYRKLLLETTVLYAQCAILTLKCICFWISVFPEIASVDK